jgi:hypothetical protein
VLMTHANFFRIISSGWRALLRNRAVDLLLTMHAGWVCCHRVGPDYRSSEGLRCLSMSRYVDPCLRALPPGLSLASDPVAGKAEPPSSIVSMIEYLALELTDRSSPAATASRQPLMGRRTERGSSNATQGDHGATATCCEKSAAHSERTRAQAGGTMMAQEPRQPGGLAHRSCPASGQFGGPHATAAYPPRAAFAAGQPRGCRVRLTVAGPRVAAAALLWESRPWQVMAFPMLSIQT